jgi:predicted  nucleic acid-binding Zn-ribbon protein
MVMGGFPGLNRAVPNAPLLHRSDPARLELDSMSWRHLNRYLVLVEDAPEPHDSGAASAPALAELRSVVNEFGSPKRLALMTDQRREVLATDQSPENLHLRILRVIAQLGRSADFVAATLNGFSAAAGAPDQAKQTLQQLGSAAAKARDAIGPLAEALKHFKPGLLGANAALAQAYSKDAEKLRSLQEEGGRLAAKLEGLQNEVARLGFFSSGKKHQLEREITALTGQREESQSRSEDLRRELAAVEPIVNEGFWVESALDDLVGGLDKLRNTLTAFGSAMTQLAADVSDAQLRDAAAIAAALGKDTAISQWRAVGEAAERFVSQNPGDVTTADASTRGK